MSVVCRSRRSKTAPVSKACGDIRALSEFPGVFGFKTYTVRVYSRSDIGYGAVINGPAVIVELTATTVVPPEWSLRMDENGSMVMVKN